MKPVQVLSSACAGLLSAQMSELGILLRMWSTYWGDSPYRNLAAMLVCFAIVLTEVELLTSLKRRSILSVNVSRKLVRLKHQPFG